MPAEVSAEEPSGRTPLKLYSRKLWQYAGSPFARPFSGSSAQDHDEPEDACPCQQDDQRDRNRHKLPEKGDIRITDRKTRKDLDGGTERRARHGLHRRRLRQDNCHRVVLQAFDRTADQAPDLRHEEIEIDPDLVFDEHGGR